MKFSFRFSFSSKLYQHDVILKNYFIVMDIKMWKIILYEITYVFQKCGIKDEVLFLRKLILKID